MTPAWPFSLFDSSFRYHPKRAGGILSPRELGRATLGFLKRFDNAASLVSRVVVTRLDRPRFSEFAVGIREGRLTFLGAGPDTQTATVRPACGGALQGTSQSLSAASRVPVAWAKCTKYPPLDAKC